MSRGRHAAIDSWGLESATVNGCTYAWESPSRLVITRTSGDAEEAPTRTKQRLEAFQSRGEQLVCSSAFQRLRDSDH